MKSVLLMLVAVIATAGLSADALAGGGGGAKKNSWIKVTNNTSATEDFSGVIGVIVDKDPATIAERTESAFTAAGGKVVQPGKYAKFTVTAASHKVYVLYFNSAADVYDSKMGTYSVGKGQTVSVNATNSGLSN